MSLYWVWYALLGVLFAGYAVLDGFDLGVGVLYPFLARDEDERSVLRRAIGPVWDGNEVWLITAGGALFAAFPFAYAFAFSGFYLAIMLVLFGLIVRAASLEFRHRDQRWARLWDGLFFCGSLAPALLFGVAVGNLVRGVTMSYSQGPAGLAIDYAGTFWQLLNPYSLLVGVLSLAMFATQGAAWAALKTEGALHDRAVRTRSVVWTVFVALLVVTTIVTALAVREHFTANATSVLGWLFICLAAAGILGAGLAMQRADDRLVFLTSSLTVLGLVGLWGNGNWPYIVPATSVEFPHGPITIDIDALRQLGIRADVLHSSNLTLTVMLIITAVCFPLVLAYTAYVYRTFAGKVRPGEGEY